MDLTRFNQYRSHKVVTAAEISWVSGHSLSLVQADGQITTFEEFDPKLFARYTPEPGDYLVVYEDGYQSFSPKQAFEDGYTRMETTSVPLDCLSFGTALAHLKNGRRIARSGWNGKGMFIYHVGPGRYPPSTEAGRIIASEQPDGLVPYLAYIAMKTVGSAVVPWLASQTDVLAEDWYVLPEHG
jgi:hypothetical protein